MHVTRPFIRTANAIQSKPTSKTSLLEYLAMSDREAAIMSVATAIGGCQPFVMRKAFLGDYFADNFIDTTVGKVTAAMGAAALATGLLGITERVNIKRSTSIILMGYGVPVLLNIAIPYISQTLLKSKTPSKIGTIY